jgi:hypothetical protein
MKFDAFGSALLRPVYCYLSIESAQISVNPAFYDGKFCLFTHQQIHFSFADQPVRLRVFYLTVGSRPYYSTTIYRCYYEHNRFSNEKNIDYTDDRFIRYVSEYYLPGKLYRSVKGSKRTEKGAGDRGMYK